MATARQWVYSFGGGKADGDTDQKELLGGKGAGLAEMTRIGLPVPAGFTITTEACDAYHRTKQWPSGLEQEVKRALAKLERTCRKKLGDPKNPLLVSVRSGAAKSMPGMMETILNLGLNDASVEGLAKQSGSRRFAMDAYRRLIMMYGSTAKGIERALFDDVFDDVKENKSRPRLNLKPLESVPDTEISAEELEEIVAAFKGIYRDATSEDFPQDPYDQLVGAVDAVFESWMAEKAVTYRRVENITGLKGTAVNICQMVFGNMGDDCGTGVCFTRDPSTGAPDYYGDLLINAQGEDVVAGIRTPLKLDNLQSLMPEVYDQLEAVRIILEVHYKEMQDLEFTIERNKLYMLQCRVGKRSPQAAFKIAVDQATQGLMTKQQADRLVKKRMLPRKYAAAATKPVITKDEAIARIAGQDVERLFYPVLDSSISRDELSSRKIGEGIGAVPGAACGEVVFTADDAEARASEGKQVILVRKETSPEDVGGMYAAVGILTATGGKTSHAAVVARGWGKCCIVGCDQLKIDMNRKLLTINGSVVEEGHPITLDGGSGEVFGGEMPLDRPEPPEEYETLLSWCDQRRRMGVRTNADTPEDAAKAVEFGAEGIGLCRTEHMFFNPDEPQRLTAMREMILADSEQDRRSALDKLLPYQTKDFEGIFAAMNGKPVTIRLLDPPLHEFLPHSDNAEGQRALVEELNSSTSGKNWSDGGVDVLHAIARTVTVEDIQQRVDQLHESNPMLGHRGCRLSITYPEVLEMQVRAIIEAAISCSEQGITVLPEIMIPLSIDSKELGILVNRVRAVADAITAERNCTLKYLVGTMVETPRAALTADSMAQVAEFFSFGTNDLTQMTMGLSRDDAGRFLPDYVDADKTGIFNDDPFQSIDVDGVGMLVELAVKRGRAARKRLKLGICGEHGGDPASIHFCERVALDYVSCSPYRVPIARLASAQAVIATEGAPKREPKATPTKSASRKTPAAVKKKKVAAKPKKKAKVKKKSTAGKKTKKKTKAKKKPATVKKTKKKSKAPKRKAAKKKPVAKKKKKVAKSTRGKKKATKKKKVAGKKKRAR